MNNINPEQNLNLSSEPGVPIEYGGSNRFAWFDSMLNKENVIWYTTFIFIVTLSLFNIHVKEVYVNNVSLEVFFTSILSVGCVYLLFVSNAHRSHLWSIVSSEKIFFLCLVSFFVFGLVSFVSRFNDSYLMLDQISITLNVVWVAIFTLFLCKQERLHFFLFFFCVFVSAVNGMKILGYYFLGENYNGEVFRVFHNETDVILAGLCLLGLWVCHNVIKQRSKLIWFVLCCANAFILAISVKRSAFASVFVILLIYHVFSRRNASSKKDDLFFWLSCLVVAVFVVSYFFPDLFVYLSNKTDIANESGAAWRWQAWSSAWTLFQENWLFGIGIDRFPLASHIDSSNPIYVHNSFLAVLVHYGLVGGILLFLCIFLSLSKQIKNIKRSKNEVDRQIHIFILCAQIFILLFSSFNYVLENLYQGIFFWFFMSAPFLQFGFSDSTGSNGRSVNYTNLNKLFLVLLAVFLVSSVASTRKLNNLVMFDSLKNGRLPFVVADSGNGVQELTYSDIAKLDSTGLEIVPLFKNSQLVESEWVSLIWVVPDYLFKQDKDAIDYAITMEVEGVLPIGTDFSLTGGENESVSLIDIGSEKNIYQFPLSLLGGKSKLLKNGVSFSINLPHEETFESFKIKTIRLVDIGDVRNKGEIFDRDGLNQKPSITDESYRIIQIDNRPIGMKVDLSDIQELKYAELVWQIPPSSQKLLTPESDMEVRVEFTGSIPWGLGLSLGGENGFGDVVYSSENIGHSLIFSLRDMYDFSDIAQRLRLVIHDGIEQDSFYIKRISLEPVRRNVFDVHHMDKMPSNAYQEGLDPIKFERTDVGLLVRSVQVFPGWSVFDLPLRLDMAIKKLETFYLIVDMSYSQSIKPEFNLIYRIDDDYRFFGVGVDYCQNRVIVPLSSIIRENPDINLENIVSLQFDMPSTEHDMALTIRGVTLEKYPSVCKRGIEL
ncbi:O-antigen ligase family protein [Teredinibacter sp. KSP-S5-2]|uniref:O-antigen ligase family protein n=1 Tax=Teredinibacter sp. KSP-S5-2 TaxID=3034506 RepID=UPI002934231E|nr:O-antigen ligase family protein [Teredinibacter sp. KSP-S5-2]WNO10648.1 O-antigen ligase family protein [Teredinibacter sp. KSP-S5-2]